MFGKKATSLCFVVFMLLSAFDNSPLGAGESVDNSITILYNNILGDTGSGVLVGSGFSAFIRFMGKSILFDAGGDASILLNNVRAMDLDLSELDAVMISHNHWDHVYGLPGVLSFTGYRSPVYVVSSAREATLQQNPRASIVSIEEPAQLFNEIWSTGPMEAYYRDLLFSEQALMLDNGDGIYVVTGCAHPGIVSIVERVKQLFPDKPIALVAGGFHLVNATEQEIVKISAELKKLGVKRIAPSHCTGHTAMQIFKEEWGEHYVRLYLGDSYRF